MTLIQELLKKKKEFQYYGTKLVVLVIYAFLYSVALNIFWRNGNVYAGGVTGISQIITTLWGKVFQRTLSISVVYYVLNIPLFILGWLVVDRKFMFFTIVGVTLVSFSIDIIPTIALTTDPIICAVFGGALSGYSLGLALKNGLSTGGMDIVLLGLRKLTGKSVGTLSMVINGSIVLAAGFIFGWPHALYSVISIFVSAKATDLIYVKHQLVQVMVITQHGDSVIECLQHELTRGITVIYNAQGGYQHEEQTVLITVISHHELEVLEKVVKGRDAKAFISVAHDIEILSEFEEEII